MIKYSGEYGGVFEMNKGIQFYKCQKCGNVIELIDGEVNHLNCCGIPMEQMSANTTDASTEKHVPVYDRVEDEIAVRVGEVEHPMEKDHYIVWIAQVLGNKITRVTLYPEQATETRFPYIKGSTIYAYCNKHGLWKTIVK